MGMINRDAAFFAENGLMDYSLLLGVEEVKSRKTIFNITDSRSHYRSECGKYIYHLSIIDYLQRYTMIKRLETIWKQMTTSSRAWDISSIESKKYKKRFIYFMKSKVFR